MKRGTIGNCYLLAGISIFLLSGCSSVISETKPPLSAVESEMLRKNGNALVRSGNFQEAVKIFDKLIEHDPSNALAHNGKAVAFDYSGNHLAAQDIYKTAISLSPDSLPIKNNLAMSLILNQQTQQAIKLLEPLALNNSDKSPHSNIIRNNLALAYGVSGQGEKVAKLNLGKMTEKQAKENLRFYEDYITRNVQRRKHLEKSKKGGDNIGFITPSLSPLPKVAQVSTSAKENLPAQSPKNVAVKDQRKAESNFTSKYASEDDSKDKMKTEVATTKKPQKNDMPSSPQSAKKPEDKLDSSSAEPTFLGKPIFYEYPE